MAYKLQLPRRHDGTRGEQRQRGRRRRRAQRRTVSRPHRRTDRQYRKNQGGRNRLTQRHSGAGVLGTAMLLVGENSRAVANGSRPSSSKSGVRGRKTSSRSRSTIGRTWSKPPSRRSKRISSKVLRLWSSSFSFKAAIATACVIPQSLLFTITSMVENISAYLMSLGEVDFGNFVQHSTQDTAIMMVPNRSRTGGSFARKGTPHSARLFRGRLARYLGQMPPDPGNVLGNPGRRKLAADISFLLRARCISPLA